MQGYLVQAPGQKCQRCGADTSYYAQQTRYCDKCKKAVSHENTIKRIERRKLLEERDTAKPMQSRLDMSYVQHIPAVNIHKAYCCPVCDSEVNVTDNFCRYCGQRLEEERTCLTLNDAFSVEFSKKKTNSESTPIAEKTELKEDIEPAKAARQ